MPTSLALCNKFMTTPLPKMRANYGEAVGVELFFTFPSLQSTPFTYLDADSAIGASTITANGNDFSANNYAVIGQPGNEKSEIFQVSSATSTSIVINGTLSFAHNRGDIVRFIPYNQIVPERSTDSGANFSALSALSIRPDASE